MDIQDHLSDRKTPYERRFGTPFNGPVIPFGPMVEHHPISAKDFGPKVLPGFFPLDMRYTREESGKETH